MKQAILGKEIPFNELEECGISRNAFLDLPKKVLDSVLTGRISPLLQLNIKHNDKLFKIPAKIALIRDNGNVSLRIFPVRKTIDNVFKLDIEEIEKLKSKKTIVKTIDNGKGKEKLYLQLDEETNNILSAKHSDVVLPNCIDGIELGKNQKEQIKKGKPMVLDKDNSKVTIGIDLNATAGFRIVKGDLREWEMKKAIKWDMENPGAMGFWKTSENGWQYNEYMKEKEGVNNNRGFKR